MPDAKRRPCARRTTRIAALFLAIASAVAGGPLRAGLPPAVVKGKVIGWEKLQPQVYAETAKDDSHRYTWREPSPTVKQEFRKLSASVSRDVCVAAFASGAPHAHEPVSVKVTGGRMTPATLVLGPGSRVSFKNADPFPHALYEVNNAKWAPNPTAPGSSREWAASATGVHEMRDQLFPSVVMYVVVDPATVEFALPDREGVFSMTLPAGEYTFKAFFDGKQVSKELTGPRVGEHGLFDLKEPLAVGGDSK
jgi:plastocyanin